MNCQHWTTKTELMTSGPHYAKIICVDCGRFVAWAKNPATIEKEKRNAKAIVRLRQDSRMKAHERAFIESLDGQGPKMSPRQQEWLDALEAKYV